VQKNADTTLTVDKCVKVANKLCVYQRQSAHHTTFVSCQSVILAHSTVTSITQQENRNSLTKITSDL